MQNSADSIYHFTDNIETVKTILTDKFKGSYCKEVLNYNNELVPMYIPMISFCDTPLKTYSNLGAIYGKYGIGMSKNWAIKNKLNPVLYIDKNSLLLENFINALKGSLTTIEIASKVLKNNPNKQGASISKNMTNSVEYLTYSLYHTKHYQDNLPRLDNKEYRFYDEREWRFIPEFQCAVCQLKKSEEEFNVWRKQSKKKPLLEEVSLEFDFLDIEHIVIEKNEDLIEIIETIKNIEDSKLKGHQKELLYAKIICFEKLERDF
ncbi:abortive infection system antitoxin AbiGi family protein [Flavobacterium covae]